MGEAMNCPICDYENAEGATKCAFCSAFLPDENFGLVKPRGDKKGKRKKRPKRREVWTPVPEGIVRCLGCWHDNPEGTTLCEKCGVKLMKPLEAPDYEMIKQQQKKPLPKGILRRVLDVRIPGVYVDSTNEWPPTPRTLEEYWESEDAGEKKSDKLLSWLTRPEPEEPITLSELLLGVKLEREEKRKEREEEQKRIEQSKNRSKINRATPGMLRCRNCWHDNPTDATLCEECGARLQPDRPTPKTRKKHWPGDP